MCSIFIPLLSGKKNREWGILSFPTRKVIFVITTQQNNHGQKYPFYRTADIQSVVILHTGSKYQQDSE
jgi:hypothetical protein